jgi:hypothetical protein
MALVVGLKAGDGWGGGGQHTSVRAVTALLIAGLPAWLTLALQPAGCSTALQRVHMNYTQYSY